jgi:hypothetical protein
MYKFKTLKGLFPELVYCKNNQKQQVATSNPKVNVLTIKLEVVPIEHVEDVQGSKGIVPKSKLKLKPLKELDDKKV